MPVDFYAQLYSSRCYGEEGSLKPHWWNPQPISEFRPQLFSVEDIQDEEVDKSLKKLIALGLELELPVGDFIRQASKRDLPKSQYMSKLLKSNIRDEAAHYKGFKYANDIINTPYIEEAKLIREEWESMPSHPIELARHLEVGVFLVTLGYMRIVGGSSLNHMAEEISRDESRHVSTNTQIVNDLGLKSDLLKHSNKIIDWIFDGSFSHPMLGYSLTKDFFLQESKSLVIGGIAPRLQELIECCGAYVPPFETSNSDIYSRTTEKPLELLTV